MSSPASSWPGGSVLAIWETAAGADGDGSFRFQSAKPPTAASASNAPLAIHRPRERLGACAGTATAAVDRPDSVSRFSRERRISAAL